MTEPSKATLDDAYIELLKDNRIYDSTLPDSASFIAKHCALALSVTRASVWVSSKDGKVLECLALYCADHDALEQGALLESKAYPGYFNALHNERVIDASNAVDDPRTAELADSYLVPLDIHSLLDATLRHQGRVRGVLCLEMRGRPRRWTQEEQMFVASVADLVSQRLIIDELAASESRYQALYESTTEGISIFSGSEFMDVNPAMCQIFRCKPEDLIGKSPIEISPEFQSDGRRSDELALEKIEACLQGTPQRFEWTHRRLDGTNFPAEVLLNTIKLGGEDDFFAIIRDITERKDAEGKALLAQNELEYRAAHDSLTGLQNRERLHMHVTDIIARSSAECESSKIALLLFDLNRFKEINDTLGHATGDRVLVKISEVLNNQIAAIGGNLFRLGGDEFVAVFEAHGCSEPFENLSKILHKCLKTSINIDDITVELGASIGVALYPENGKDSHELLRCADVAMYHAKNSDGRTSWYDTRNDLNNKRRLAMMVELGAAIRDDQLTLHFQPRINVNTGELTGCEALIRWNHPRLGMVPPGEFLPLVEMSELIHPLSDWVLVNVIKQIQHLQSTGREIPIAMNISARNLSESLLVDRVESLLSSEGIEPSLLEVEITESALINLPHRALLNLDRLDKLGVSIAIDDFGTGYSSLSYLKKLPVDTLKIDRSFVKDMLTDESDSVIVDSTISLAHNFSLTVVAEGVEDEETFIQLGLKNCDQAQGYFIAKPMSAVDFDQWLDDHLDADSRFKLAS